MAMKDFDSQLQEKSSGKTANIYPVMTTNMTRKKKKEAMNNEFLDGLHETK